MAQAVGFAAPMSVSTSTAHAKAVTLMEYVDYACPDCRAMQLTLLALPTAYPQLTVLSTAAAA